MTHITSTIKAIQWHGRELLNAVPYHPVQIIMSRLLLVLSIENGDILAAGSIKECPLPKKQMNRWTKYSTLEFSTGSEPLQTQYETFNESLVLNAAGMLKLCVVFDGELSKFLAGNSLNNAQRFIRNVAGDGQKGATSRYSLNQMSADARWMIS